MVWWWRKSLWRWLERTLCRLPWGFGVSDPPFLRITSLYQQPRPAPDSFPHDLGSLMITLFENTDFLDENLSYDYKTIISTNAFVNLITVPTQSPVREKVASITNYWTFQMKNLNQELLSLTLVTIYQLLLCLNQLQKIFNKLSALKRLQR